MTNQFQQQETKPKWWRALIEGDYLSKRPRRRDICKATILSISDRDILIDLDGKRDGIILRDDLANVDDAYLAQLQVGDRIPVGIVKVPYNRSAIMCSLKQGLEQQNWINAETTMQSKEVVEVEVTEANRGGLVAAFGELRGFIPNSHLISVSRRLHGRQRTDRMLKLIGQVLPVVVIEVNSRKRRLILSERLAQHKRREALLDELYEGAIRTGVVNNIVPYGAFIDLGGIDGLLHISEFAWKHIADPHDVLNVGDEVEVYVLNVDRQRERVGLSRKRLLPPSEDPAASYVDALVRLQKTTNNKTT